MPSDNSTQAFSADTFPHLAACFIAIGVTLALIGCVVAIVTIVSADHSAGTPKDGQMIANAAMNAPTPKRLKQLVKKGSISSLPPEALVLFSTPWVLPAIIAAIFLGAVRPKRRD